MFFYQVDEIIKQVTAIVRTGGAFGMVLHRKCRFIFQTYAFDGFVVQIHMGYFHIRSLSSPLQGPRQIHDFAW